MLGDSRDAMLAAGYAGFFTLIARIEHVLAGKGLSLIGSRTFPVEC
jgi:hypothetical protein